MEMMRFQSSCFQLKNGAPAFGKRFSFSIKSISSIENIQLFHSLSHKNMTISQTEGYFENYLYPFLEEPMLFPSALKWNV